MMVAWVRAARFPAIEKKRIVIDALLPGLESLPHGAPTSNVMMLTATNQEFAVRDKRRELGTTLTITK
jgi:hypothetical protein